MIYLQLGRSICREYRIQQSVRLLDTVFPRLPPQKRQREDAGMLLFAGSTSLRGELLPSLDVVSHPRGEKYKKAGLSRIRVSVPQFRLAIGLNDSQLLQDHPPEQARRNRPCSPAQNAVDQVSLPMTSSGQIGTFTEESTPRVSGQIDNDDLSSVLFRVPTTSRALVLGIVIQRHAHGADPGLVSSPSGTIIK